MKKIKKFFITNIILSFILVGSLYFLSWIWINYTNESSVKFLELERNKNINNLKIINLGSSHTTYGIKYPKNIKGYNMGLSSQKFYYDFEVLKKYYKKLDQNCIIIIPISIFSFYNGYDVKDITPNYISFIDRKALIGLTKEEYLLGKHFSITQPLSRIPKIINYICISLENKKMEKTFVKYSKNLSLEEKRTAAIGTAYSHLGVNDKRFSHNKEKGIKLLIDILNFCEEYNFKPILITTPQTYLYNEQIGEKNYQERIYNNIQLLEKETGKKYLYLDYSHDERFENNLEYFSDDDHLNEKGVEYFTEILLNDIKKYGYDF